MISATPASHGDLSRPYTRISVAWQADVPGPGGKQGEGYQLLQLDSKRALQLKWTLRLQGCDWVSSAPLTGRSAVQA